MSEVRFKVPTPLSEQLAEFQELGGFDTIGSAVKTLLTIYLEPTVNAIKRGQQAIASGSPQLQPVGNLPQPLIAPAQVTSPTVGGFGDSLSSLLKS